MTVIIGGDLAQTGVKHKTIACATTGANTLIAAVSGKQLKVLSMVLAGSGTANTLYLSSGTAGGTRLFANSTSRFKLDVSGTAGSRDLTLPTNEYGWMRTNQGAALIVNLSAGQAIVGAVTYQEV